MSEDELEKWKGMIDWADTWTEQIRKESPVEQARYNYQRCISALAAELRALQEKIAFEKAKTDQFVAEALKITAEQDAEAQALRERVAELETDAVLGKMVREMPRHAKLGHEGQQHGEWYAVWPGDNYKYNRQYGSTPEAVLEAAQKEAGP